MIVIAIIGVIMAIAQPAYKRYRDYSNTRACFSNQKTLSSALQAYNLDKNSKRNDIPAVLPTLADSGYIRVVPDDPGVGPGTWGDYMGTSLYFGITCKVHGPLR